MDIRHHFEQQQVKDVQRPRLQPGDIIRIDVKVTEGEKTRVQAYEGTVLGIRGSGPSVTVTVRRETSGFGVERIFPLYSPLITAIEIIKRQKVRRAKLTHLRLAGRRRVKEDVAAMQRHRQEEETKKRLAEEAKRRAEEEEQKAIADAKKAEEKAKQEAEASAEAKAAETSPKEQNPT
jgi:large subunit ribosomal protein L19